MTKTALAVSLVLAASSASAHAAEICNAGVGLYTDPSVAGQISTFTLTPTLVSCGVGDTSVDGPMGPFHMLMFSTDIESYKIDRRQKTIVATGSMRSITNLGGNRVENVVHDFIAVGSDRSSSGGVDRFDVHMKTTFWNQSNPACTASNLVAGGCRFGGGLIEGEVSVAARN